MARKPLSAPEWKAPETLLPRVMAAVERDRAVRPAALPVPALRIAAVVAALAALAVAQWALWIGTEMMHPVAAAITVVLGIAADALAVAGALGFAILALTTKPAALPVMVIVGVSMALVWNGAVSGFYLILHSEQRRSVL